MKTREGVTKMPGGATKEKGARRQKTEETKRKIITYAIGCSDF
jgi:hypothetical protein